MCLWANYIFPRWVCLFCWRKYVDRSWEYTNCSQTHECRNWGWGRAIPRKGIYKRNYRCSAEPMVMNSWSQTVYGSNRLLSKEMKNRQWKISEESRQTGLKTCYVPPSGLQDCGLLMLHRPLETEVLCFHGTKILVVHDFSHRRPQRCHPPNLCGSNQTTVWLLGLLVP